MEIVIGFGIFKIRIDFRKFFRLESWMTWTILIGVRKMIVAS